MPDCRGAALKVLWKTLLTAAVLAGVAFGAGIWLNRGGEGMPQRVSALPVDPSCDLRARPCRLALPGAGEVVFGILPMTLPPMEPLTLTVEVTGSPFRARWVEFAGVDMNMGPNRAGLEAQGGGRYRGTGTIPVCVRDRMTWEARVMLADGDEWVSAPFRFDVVRN